MTDEYKDILMAKMLDAPSTLSDEELDAILQDEELREIHEASAVLVSAYTHQPEPDIESEWNRFRPRMRVKPSPMRWMTRVAAILAGAILVSAIALQIKDNTFSDGRLPAIAGTGHPEKPEDSSPSRHIVLSAEPEHKTHVEPTGNNSHSTIHPRHSDKREITVQKEEDTESGIEQNNDIDEYIRTRQAHIDNELAMQVAGAYLEEYDRLEMIWDATGGCDTDFSNAVRKVTME